jgi:hypothetical protein
VPTVSLRRTPHRDHLVVCGDDALAARTVEELTIRYGEYVTVILPSRDRNFGPRIARLPGVRVIERDDLSSEPGAQAGLAQVRRRVRGPVRRPGHRLRAAQHRGRVFADERALPHVPGRRGRGGHQSAPAAAGEGRAVPAHLRRHGVPAGVDRGRGRRPPHRIAAGQAAAADRSRGRGRAGECRHQDRGPAARPWRRCGVRGRQREPARRRPGRAAGPAADHRPGTGCANATRRARCG